MNRGKSTHLSCAVIRTTRVEPFQSCIKAFLLFLYCIIAFLSFPEPQSLLLPSGFLAHPDTYGNPRTRNMVIFLYCLDVERAIRVYFSATASFRQTVWYSRRSKERLSIFQIHHFLSGFNRLLCRPMSCKLKHSVFPLKPTLLKQ